MSTVGKFKIGIKLEKNKKKACSATLFSLLAALSNIDGHREDLTKQDK